MENVGSQKLIFRDSRCTDEKATAKLWAKRLTAYHRLHLKHPKPHSVLLAGLEENSRKQGNNSEYVCKSFPEVLLSRLRRNLLL